MKETELFRKKKCAFNATWSFQLWKCSAKEKK